MRRTVCVHQNHKSLVRLIIGCLRSMSSVRSWGKHCILAMCAMCAKARGKFNFELTNKFRLSLPFYGVIFFSFSVSFSFVRICFVLGLGGALCAKLRRFPPVLSTKSATRTILQTMMLFSVSFGWSLYLFPYSMHHAIYCSIVSRITIAFSYKL